MGADRRDATTQPDYRALLARAAYVAERLLQMIDPQTWRDSGGDDGQGHYEGDYRADQIHAEIESWKGLAATCIGDGCPSPFRSDDPCPVCGAPEATLVDELAVRRAN